MGINENTFLKRRITSEELNYALQEALEYCTVMYKRKHTNNVVSLERFVYSVISMTIDEIHPKLIQDLEEFPHWQVFKFILERFREEIYKKYYEEFS